MAFSSGTITSDTPAAALVTAIEAELTTHTNWTFVEEVVISTFTYRVWECLGTGNSFGTSFFVVLACATGGTGNLTIKCMEQWQPAGAAADRARRIVVMQQNVAPNDIEFTFNDTTDYALDSSLFMSVAIPTNTTGFEWYLQVSINRICVGSKVGTGDYGCYVGLFEPLMPSDPFPLVMLSNTYSTWGYAGASRHPNKTTATTYNWRFFPGQFLYFSSTENVGVNNLFYGTAIASRVVLNAVSTAAIYGSVRGLLYDVVLCDVTTSVRSGDTITVDGVTYTYMRVCAPASAIYQPGVWVKNTAV